MNETKVISIRLPTELWRRLKQLALNRDTSMKDLVIQAVTDKLKKEETK